MAGKKKANNATYLKKRINEGTLFLIPTYLFTLAFIVVPIVYVFIISLHKWNGSAKQKMQFVGLQNFTRLTTISGFNEMMVFTIIFAIVGTFITVGIALIVAFALDKPQGHVRYVNRSFLRACWYVPTLIGGIAVGVVWRIMYNYSNGLFNTIIKSFGGSKVNWLETRGLTGVAVIIAHVWVHLGMNIIIFLAGLQGIPTELYEAAKIDGATAFQQKVRIALPMLAPTITICMVTTSISSFKSYELPFTISKGLPGHSSMLITRMIYQYSLENLDYGRAAALSVVLILLIVAVQLVQLFILQKREDIY